MKKGRNTSADAAELRRKAKARLRAAATKGAPAPTEAGTQRLLHELQVHQVELEMQNEELCKSRAEVEAGLERYTELYDFAPVGYVTLGRDGAVHQVNLTGARLLGVDRARLKGRRFGGFVVEPDRAGFQAFLEKVFASQAKEVCEVALREEGKGPLHVQLTATVSRGGRECRVMMADITEHQRTLKTLQTNEQRLQHALEATTEGVWDWNIRTGEVLFSRNWKTSLGYSPDEVPDRVEFWESTLHPEDLPRVRQALGDHFAGRTPLYVCENRLRMKSGEYRANLDRGKVVERDASGNPVRMVGTDTDIRAHRKTMDDLRHAKNDLEAIFDASQQAVFLMDTKGIVLHANTGLARRLNHRVEEIVGKSISDFLPADVANRRRHYGQEVIHTRKPVIFEDTRGDRIISQTVNPVFDSQGNVIRLAVYGEDVTEQRLSEQALRESEESYRRIVETASEGIWSMDGGYRTTYVNRHMADMLGYAPEEIIGRRVDAFMFPEDAGDHSAKMAIRAKGEGSAYERRFRRKDGRELWTIVAATALKDAEGNFAGSFAMFTDVTERKRAEQSLLESEVRYRIVADNTYDWECWLSPDGNFLYSSPSCERITGYTAGDFLRRPSLMREIVHPDDRVTWDEHRCSAGRAQRAVAIELRIIRADGDTRWIEHICQPVFDPAGKYLGSRASNRDTTERKRGEEALREYEIMVASSSDAISLVGHDYVYKTVNTTLMRRTGLRRDQIVGRAVAEIMGAEVFEKIIRPGFDRALAGETVTYAEWFEFPALGRRFYDVTYTPCHNHHSEIIGVVVVSHDITGRKRGEEALQTYETIVSSSHDSIALVGRDYVYKTANDTFLRRTGMARDRVVGRPVAEVVGQTVFDEVLKPAIDRCLVGEKVVYAAWFDFAPTGRRYMELTCSPCRSTNSEMIGAVVVARDVTERKAAEEATARSEAVLNRTQQLAGVGGWEWDVKQQTMFWTQETYRIHDLVPGELIPGSAEHVARSLACYDAPDRPRIREAFRRCAEEGAAYDIEFPFTSAKGRRLWVRTIAEAVLDRGRVARVVGNIMDITERKRLEEILQARLRLSEAVATLSLDELLQQALDETERLTGSCIGFIHFVEEDQRTLSLQMWSTNTLEKMCTAEGKGRHYDLGEAGVWVDCIRERRPVIHNDYAALPHRKELPAGHAPVVRELVVPILHNDRIVAVLGVGNKPQDYSERDVETVESLANMAWDIVLRKKMEAALRESEERFRRTFDESPVGVAIVSCDFRFLQANAALCHITGYSSEELTGMEFGKITHPEDLAADLQQAQRLLSGEIDQYDMEKRYIHKDGGECWVHLWIKLLRDRKGRPLCFLPIIEDIAIRKRMERELHLSKVELRDLYHQLQNAREEERRRISREIHDELGQNITAMQLDLAWLKKKVDPVRPDLLAKLDSMNQIAESALATVRRVSAELRPGILDALGLPAAVDWLVRDFEKRSEILCSLLIEPEEIEVEQNLATDVFRVLQEALTNVARHARASSLQVTLRQNAGMLELEVADDGIGISEAEISRPGSLGLLGIRERLLAHGGDITLRRLPGQGTCLSAVIPAQSKEG